MLFLNKTFDDFDLADGLGKTAAGNVQVEVNFCLILLPLAAGFDGHKDVDRVQAKQQQRDRPAKVGDNGQRQHGTKHELQEVVAPHLHEVGDLGDGAVQAIDDFAGQLGVKILLRQLQQVLVVVMAEDSLDSNSHLIAQVAADVTKNGAGHIQGKDAQRQPNNSGDVAVGTTGFNGVNGLAA